MEIIFNKSDLSSLQVGRLEKSLNTKYNFSEGIYSLKEYILKFATGKGFSKGGVFNRTHFNRLDYEGQKKYEENLAKKINYHITTKEGFMIDIPKIVFDSLVFKDVENCVECGKEMNDLEHNYGTDTIPVCIHCYNDAQIFQQ